MIWFTSDMHIGHANIIDYTDRPFRDAGGNPDVPMQTEIIVKNWNETVAPDDLVYIVGDAVMGRREETLSHISRLNGTKYLVLGNHDYAHPALWENKPAKLERWTAAYAERFDFMATEVDLAFPNGKKVKLCHFPFTGDSHDKDRYSDLRPVDDGETWLIHGHTHQPEKISGPRQIHVGVDAWDFRPASLEEVMALMVD